MNKLTKIIRVITIPPIMALVLFVSLYICVPDFFGSTLNFALAIFFISALPVLAYPLQGLIPGFKGKGREGQRNLAMIFSVLGYFLGCLSCFIFKAPLTLWLVYLVYLVSGVCIFVFSKAIHFKASGHACGIMGPVAFLLYFGVYWAVGGILVYLAALWASVKMKRHTVPQFIVGAAIPVVALLALSNILNVM